MTKESSGRVEKSICPQVLFFPGPVTGRTGNGGVFCMGGYQRHRCQLVKSQRSNFSVLGMKTRPLKFVDFVCNVPS